jgi:spore coat protein CotH
MLERAMVPGRGARGSGGILGAVVAAILVVTVPARPADAQPGPGANPQQPEVKVVERFDADRSGWLDAEERAAAVEWLRSTPAGNPAGAGRGGPPPGGPPGPGGFGGRPPGVAGGPPGGPPGFAGAAGGGRGGGPAGQMVPGTPGARVAPGGVPSYPGTDLYDPSILRTLFLDFEAADWERELAAFHNTDVEVPATLTVDGRRYEMVGVRFRGASSFRFVPDGSKRSLNLSLDFLEDDQRVEGFRTLNLLNAMRDPTFVRTALYSEIARAYLPAPRVNFVRVVINGEDWGVYLNAQQFNKDFLQDFYGTGDGARWKTPGSPRGRAGMQYLGEDVAAYRDLYEIRSKDDPASWARLIELFRILEETPVEGLEAALEPILDVDGALRFLAVEVALVNSDGFWSRASDYNLYLDPAGRFHVIPHDMNEALGLEGSARLDPLVGLDDRTKPLRSKLLAVPALRARYEGYVRDIAEQWLDWDRLAPLVAQHQALIREAVHADTRKLYPTDAFTTDVENLRRFAEERRAFLLQ